MEKKKQKSLSTRSLAAKRGKTNKRKGNTFELEVVHKLTEIGYNVGTSRANSKATDDNKIDIFSLDGKLPVNIQTKYQQATPNFFEISEQCTDKTKPFCVIWKKAVKGKKSPGTVAIIDAEYFYQLINNGKSDSNI